MKNIIFYPKTIPGLEFTCEVCGCIFSCDKEDYTDFSSPSGVPYRKTICPVCHSNLIYADDDIQHIKPTIIEIHEH